MKPLLLLAAITAMVGLAAPAQADSASDASFLSALSGAGLSHKGPDQVAVSAGHAVCALMDNGLSPMDTVVAVQTTNPGFTIDRAAQFAAISVKTFCPQYM